jgi:hypothetical protein
MPHLLVRIQQKKRRPRKNFKRTQEKKRMIPKNDLPKIIAFKQIMQYSEKLELQETLNRKFPIEVRMDMQMIASLTTKIMINNKDQINNLYQQLHRQKQTKDQHKASNTILQLKTQLIENEYIKDKFEQETATINTDDENKTHYYDKMCIGYLATDS